MKIIVLMMGLVQFECIRVCLISGCMNSMGYADCTGLAGVSLSISTRDRMSLLSLSMTASCS